MKAIVTGGAGFIGSHLVELLLKRDFEVVVLDNMVAGQQENIDLFIDNPNYDFVKVDLHTPFNPDIFQGVDYVFHLAGLADIIPSINNPKKYFDSNVTATLNVLEASRKAGVKKLIFSASSSCYGTSNNTYYDADSVPRMVPVQEDAPINCMYPYALTKRMGEELVLHWGKTYKLPVVSLRLFNVYGPRARSNNVYGAVFKVFLSQKLHNKPFTIVGDGTQTRAFVYVKDVAKALFLAAVNYDPHLVGQVINIGGPSQNINTLAELIGGKDYPKEYLPWRPGEPKHLPADITKAKDLLGWEPTTSFEEGVKIMVSNIEYFKDTPAWTKEEVLKATESWNNYLGGRE